MPLMIIRNDITKMKADAIVNAANTELLMGGGVCGAIFDAAGADMLQDACDALAPIHTGEAVITPGFDLPAKFIVHTAGPVYAGGKHNEETLLRNCYRDSLDIAAQNGCGSIAFPLISSGIYGYPKDEALAVATSTIGEWLMGNDMDVSLVVFDKAAFAVSHGLLGEIKAFIDENYVDEQNAKYGRSRLRFEGKMLNQADYAAPVMHVESAFAPPMDEALKAPRTFYKLDEPFSIALMRFIDVKGRNDVDVYKRANIDRKLFSKIRNPDYRPSKKTALALAVALELSLPEARDLLEKAGFALSHSVMFDVIVEYFITREKYDIFEINNVLFEYDQPLLGG